MKTKSILLIATLLIGGFSSANERLERIKVQTGFATWPGKGGPLKKGCLFKQSDYPILQNFQIVSDKTQVSTFTGDVDQDGKRVVGKSVTLRNIQLKRGSTVLSILIGVAFDTTDLAQERLVSDVFLNFTQEDRTRSNPAAFGDVLFDEGNLVMFVRNNVFVQLSVESTLDIRALGQSMDARIVAAPTFTTNQLAALKPAITQFAATPDTLQRALDNRPWGTAVLGIVTADPSGETVNVLNIDSNSKLLIAKNSNGSLEATATVEFGTFPIVLTVVNESLLFNVATTNVTVQK